MFGSTLGNLTAILYFTYFQLAGMILISILYKKEGSLTRFLLGSVTGSLLLQWVPVLFSFFLGFGFWSHVLAALCLLPVFLWGICKREVLGRQFLSGLHRVRYHYVFLMVLGLFFVLWAYLLHTHTIPMNAEGAMLAGQCTYGDMNMHLGFITSIANQGTFPPQYSLFPGTRLSYPFLNDSISSSLYVLGASLRLAYILPMLAAFVQVAGSVYLLGHSLLGSRAKAMLTYVFFFLNGGLGFGYFLNWSREKTYTFQELFSGFYVTPTNLTEENIRWVNMIADMLLPQRATLFGYAVLFPAIWLLYQAVFHGKKEYFLTAGLFTSALPMIHTHSFLGMGLISASWLLLYLYRNVIATEKRKWHGATILGIFVAIMCFLQYWNSKGHLTSQDFMVFGILGLAVCLVVGILFLICFLKRNGTKEFLLTWGVFLGCVLALALPQLLFWTFGQVAEGGFLRGHFNWGNQGDFYPWFYLKNMGLPLLLILGAICAGRKQTSLLILPAGVIWFIIELIVFTPNTYDNNKLLYIAYMLLCLAAADYGVELYRSVRQIPGIKLFAGLFLFFSTFSAILTLGREAVSEYTLYNTSQVELAQYIDEHTETSDVFLTNTRHNNEIASLTGRNLVCGADTFLYFHGIDTTERKEQVQLMYEAPAANLDLYAQYDVAYVVVSPWEQSSYEVDKKWFEKNCELVFKSGNTILYKTK